MTGNWKFRKMDKAEKLVDPIQSQFFTTNIVGGLTSALVRETIQNSLDAHIDNKNPNSSFTVQIRFFLSGQKNAIHPVKAEMYFNGLIPHLKARNNGLQESKFPDLLKPMPFLLIEDYNTFGLEGDPLEHEDPPDNSDQKHNFFWFWRNVGRSMKSQDARGRWGLGKAVYPKSSNINTYFGLTVRKSDEATLLMGECILKIHKIDDENVNSYPYGYFGEFKDKESKDFVSPLDDKKNVNQFISDFRLNRIEKGFYLMGLSLVIPFPNEEITRSELIKATVLQYFYPVIQDQLIVSVEDEDTKEPIVIDSSNIDNVVNEIIFSEDDTISVAQLRKLFDFERWILSVTEEEYITLLEPELKGAPYWSLDRYLDDKLKEKLKYKIEQFEKGGRVAFKVPVKVQPEGKEPKMTWFMVYLEKDEELKEPDCHFIRDGITIVGVKPMKRKDVRALVIIEDRLLSKLLGDAENPAHTEWSKESPNFIGKYVQGEKVISFVIHSLDKLHGWLMKPAEGLDKDILDDIFFIELPEEPGDAPQPAPIKPGGVTDFPTIEPGGKPHPVVISRINGGILFKPNPNAESPPSKVYVGLAYYISGGNPLKRYSPLDFDLAKSPVTLEARNVHVTRQSENCLEFEITGKDFELSITGFDTNRDLYIKADFDD
jgi:hypothetical protein